jgi:hypothetical protein
MGANDDKPELVAALTALCPTNINDEWRCIDDEARTDPMIAKLLTADGLVILDYWSK